MNVHTKVMGTRVLAREPGPEDMKLINSFAKKELKPEQVYVASMDLANDQVDRTFERFPISYLEQFAATIVGKSLLIGHDHRSAPEGLFFKAEVVNEGGVTHLRPSFYVVKTRANEHLRAQIDGGVYRYVSIGFHYEDLICDICGQSIFDRECPHVPGQEYDGVACTATYAGEAEAVEGSIVYLGAQYGAELKKAHEERDTRRLRALKQTETRPGTSDQGPVTGDEAGGSDAARAQERLPQQNDMSRSCADTEDPASPARIDESMHSTQQAGINESTHSTERASANESMRSTELECNDVVDASEEVATAALRVSLDVANRLLEEEKERGRRLERLARDGQRYRDKLQAEILRLSGCVDRASEGRIVAEALIEADAETIEQILADYQKLFDEKYPPRPHSTPLSPLTRSETDPSEYR
jgi:hypothetical protein